MGFIFSKAMETSFQKQQQFQLETMKLQLDRQIQMQNMMREKQMAMMISGARQNLLYTGSFGALVTVACVLGYGKTKKRAVLGPILPLTFVVGYNADMAYGNMVHRIRNGAEQILCDESALVTLPGGIFNADDIDKRRQTMMDEHRFKPNDVFL